MPNIPSAVAQRDENIDKMKFQRSVDVSQASREDTKSKAPLGSIQNPYKLGEKGCGIRLQSVVQDFRKLKEECSSADKLFEDPEFPAEDTSIWSSGRPSEYKDGIAWKRPREIVDNPRLYVEGPSRFDVIQGGFGNCWMVASVAVLAMNKELLDIVMPPGEGDFDEDYAGIFRFRFWQFGRWVEVVIDDRLPTYGGKLISMHSETSNEFWSALLEKAYAKLHGTWSLLEAGLCSQALEDFTGGIGEYRKIEKAPQNLFDILLEAQKNNALLTCAISQVQDLHKSGLVGGHAYSITKVILIDGKITNEIESIPLLRVRNPYGCMEWKGAWSDDSKEWKSIPEADKKELGLVCDVDGEFWISFEDWKKHFSAYEICYLNPSLFHNIDNEICETNYATSTIEGKWVPGVSAGGNFEDLENFKHNPQYRVTFEEESTAIVALMQKNRRTQRSNSDFHLIGFHIYKLPEESESGLPRPLDTGFFEKNKPLHTNETVGVLTNDDCAPYTYFRQVLCRAKFQPGTYCVIPSSFESNVEGEFLLRIFSDKGNRIEEYDVRVGICEIDATVLEKSNLYKDVVKIRSIFRNHAGNDWEFDWREYKNVMKIKLRKGMYEQGFSDDAYRSMVALLDEDNSGKIGYHEFQRFWNSVKIWMAAFKKFDTSSSRKLEPFVLRDALKSAGYRLSHPILNLLLQRYGTEDGYVKFDDYFMCVVRLTKMISAYNELTSGGINSAGLTLDKWIETTLKFA